MGLLGGIMLLAEGKVLFQLGTNEPLYRIFEKDKRFVKDQKTLDISQYFLQFSPAMSNHSFFHSLFRLPLANLNLRAFSCKFSFYTFNRNTKFGEEVIRC